MNKRAGFTIVELLIVIVVIAILATISVVAYQGIQTRASISARTGDMKSVESVLQLYKATYGSYPQVPDGQYCVGEGFEDTSGDGVGDCRDVEWAPTRRSKNATLDAELLKVAGALQPQTSRPNGHPMVGPYLGFALEGDGKRHVYIYHTFPGNSSDVCPTGSAAYWVGTQAVLCGKELVEE